MPTPPSGQIDIATINANFGRGTNLNAYRGTIWYQPNSLNFGYFPTGAISLSDFYNKQPNDPASSGVLDYQSPGTFSFAAPLYRNFLQIQVWGGGGAGGPYNRDGAYAGSGDASVAYTPVGNIIGYGGQGGQGSATDRFGGVRFGVGGVGGGATGGNQENSAGQTGGTGDQGYGGGSPNGGGATGVPPYQEYVTTGYNGNFMGGGGSGLNATFGGRFPASSGGGGGGGYARSLFGPGTISAGATITVQIGAGGGGGCSVGANGRIYVNWG